MKLAEVVMRAAAAVLDMKEYGMLVDRDRMTQLQLHELARGAKIEAELSKAIGIAGFNPRSNKQVADFLYSILGLPKQYNRGKPNPTTDDTALQKLCGIEEPNQWQYVPKPGANMDLFNIGCKILQARNATKMSSTYYSLPCDEANRFHPDWKMHGTETGRYACLIHTYPPGAGRSIFVAPPGRSLTYFDFSQIEFRVMMWAAQDPVGMGILAAGGDVHRDTAVEVFNVLPEEVTNHQRFMAKFINFGLPYGRGPDSMAAQYNMPLAKAQEMFNNHHQKFHVLWDYLANLCRFAAKNKYVQNVFGRRRYFVDQTDAERDRQAQNMVPQSTAHDLLQRTHVRIFERLVKPHKVPKVRPVADMHDALLIEHDDEPGLVDAVKEMFEEQVLDGLHTPCGVKTCKNWGELPR